MYIYFSSKPQKTTVHYGKYVALKNEKLGVSLSLFLVHGKSHEKTAQKLLRSYKPVRPKRSLKFCFILLHSEKFDFFCIYFFIIATKKTYVIY